LAVSHTVTIPGRFNYAAPGRPGFPILYLTEDPVTALYEVGAMLGSPHRAAAPAPGRVSHWATVSVSVTLFGVVDLTRPSERRLIRVTIPELTGDWTAIGCGGSGDLAPPRRGRWHPRRDSARRYTGFAVSKALSLFRHGTPRNGT